MHFRFARAGILCAAIAAAPLLSGCVVEQRPPAAAVEVIAPRQPPAPRVEVIPPAPRPLDIVEWRPGRWHWDGREFVWVPGEWVEKPRREAHWVPGHWNERPNGTWVWVQGHWR